MRSVLSLLLLLQTIFWMLWVPGDPREILKAMPLQAASLHVHVDAGERLAQFPSSPLADVLGAIRELEPGEMEKELLEDGFPSKAKWIAGRALVWGVLEPAFGYGAKSVVFASWLGSRSVLLRWACQIGLVDGLELVTDRNGRAAGWVYRDKDLPEGLTVSFTIQEGVLLGVVTFGPMQARHLQKVYEGYLASMQGEPDVADRLGAVLTREAGPKDEGWLRSAKAGPGTFYQIHGMDADGFRIEFSGPEISGASWMSKSPDAWLTPESELALAVSEHLAKGFSGLLPEPWKTFLDVVAYGEKSSPVFISITGPDLSGRIKGLKVPAVVAGFQSGNPRGMLDRFQKELNHYAEEWGAPVILEGREENGFEVFSIKSEKHRGVFDLSGRERPACAVFEDWFLFSSSMEALGKSLANFKAGGSGLPPGAVSLDGGGYGGWADLESISGKIRAILGIAGMRYALKASDEADEARRRIRTASAVLEFAGRWDMLTASRTGAGTLVIEAGAK